MCVNVMEMTADATAENQVESLLIGGSLSQMRAPSGQGTLRQPGGPPVKDLAGAGKGGWAVSAALGLWLARPRPQAGAQQACFGAKQTRT